MTDRNTYAVSSTLIRHWAPLVTAYDPEDAIREAFRELPYEKFDAFRGEHNRMPDLNRDFVVHQRMPIGLSADTWPQCSSRWKRVR